MSSSIVLRLHRSCGRAYVCNYNFNHRPWIYISAAIHSKCACTALDTTTSPVHYGDTMDLVVRYD